MEYFSKVIDALGLSIQKKGIVEYFKIIANGDTNLLDLGIWKRIGVDKENVEVLKALFGFTIISSKFFIYSRAKFEQIKKDAEAKDKNPENKNKSREILNEHKIRYMETLEYADK